MSEDLIGVGLPLTLCYKRHLLFTRNQLWFSDLPWHKVEQGQISLTLHHYLKSSNLWLYIFGVEGHLASTAISATAVDNPEVFKGMQTSQDHIKSQEDAAKGSFSKR